MIAALVATTATDLSAVITALALLAGVVLTYLNGRRLRSVQRDQKRTHAMVEGIDDAVNGKAPGEPTMAAQVSLLDAERADRSAPLSTYNRDVGIRAVLLALDLRERVDALHRSIEAGVAGQSSPGDPPGAS